MNPGPSHPRGRAGADGAIPHWYAFTVSGVPRDDPPRTREGNAPPLRGVLEHRRYETGRRSRAPPQYARRACRGTDGAIPHWYAFTVSVARRRLTAHPRLGDSRGVPLAPTVRYRVGGDSTRRPGRLESHTRGKRERERQRRPRRKPLTEAFKLRHSN